MIFLELVPKDIHKLIDQSQWALNSFHDIHGINVPDILQVDNRSYDVCQHLANANVRSIPHIRICDFSMKDLYHLCETLQNANIVNVLLISGDVSPNPFHTIHNHNIIEVIKLLTKTYPDLSIYAAHDPYRQCLKEEFIYSQKKLDAGAKGLFTQPIFDVNLANILLDQCMPCEWFIGVSPVLTERSYNYWIHRNKVVFPSDFNLSVAHNIGIAKNIIQLCKEKNQNNYIMPITCPLSPYLDHIFST